MSVEKKKKGISQLHTLSIRPSSSELTNNGHVHHGSAAIRSESAGLSPCIPSDPLFRVLEARASLSLPPTCLLLTPASLRTPLSFSRRFSPLPCAKPEPGGLSREQNLLPLHTPPSPLPTQIVTCTLKPRAFHAARRSERSASLRAHVKTYGKGGEGRGWQMLREVDPAASTLIQLSVERGAQRGGGGGRGRGRNDCAGSC